MTIPDLPGLGLKLNMDFIREHDEEFGTVYYIAKDSVGIGSV